tara:strand:- start:207 stop:422 length:216 start_codon:yes stop_codon:yes gene_type:complete
MRNINATNNHRTLLEIMNSYNVSLRGLAAYINCSPSLLSMMINGKRKFQVKHKNNIAKVLNIRDEDIQWTK